MSWACYNKAVVVSVILWSTCCINFGHQCQGPFTARQNFPRACHPSLPHQTSSSLNIDECFSENGTSSNASRDFPYIFRHDIDFKRLAMPRETEPSQNEKAFVLQALSEGLRIDGRKLEQFRPITVNFGDELGVADVQIGKTRYEISSHSILSEHSANRCRSCEESWQEYRLKSQCRSLIALSMASSQSPPS